ncbi:MAG TPA: type II toxin-antitoxin system RelE/ParE family toxin [Terrimesophilobacter sp.]|nr:type II toxin-antitoxin system RelE/ParE family toxin [Terrimesophilobacter sp.]
MHLRTPGSAARVSPPNCEVSWRYRIGDYRVIAKINDDHLIVIALDVAHRSRIYD